MAFRVIELPELSGDGEIPWLTELLKAEPRYNGKMFQVTTVAFSTKGVMVVTKHFKAFLFKSNPYYDFLWEACTVWVENNLPTHALMALVTESSKAKFTLGVEDSLESHWVKKSETLFKLKSDLQDFSSTQTVKNPLLAVSPHSVTQKGGGGKGKTGKRGQADVAGKAADSLAKALKGEVTMEEPFDPAWDAYEAPSDL